MHDLHKSLNRPSDSYRFIFWSIVLFGLFFILTSYPMMKVRFDIWQHIGNIDRLIFDSEAKITRSNWHAVWAFIIRSIGSSDVFTHAIIVHRSQFILNAIIIYQASKLIFAALFLQDHFENLRNRKEWISSLGISSVLIWFTIIGTASTFQQAWIMWYSVNYQITLSFLFLSLALIVNVITNPRSNTFDLLNALKISISFILFLLVYLFHAGELAYLIIYLPALALCFVNAKNFYKMVFLFVALIVIAYFAEKFYVDIRPELVEILLNGDLISLYNKINVYGDYNILGGNRLNSNWNELYSLSIFMIVPITVLVWNANNYIDKRVVFFIILSLIFCFIPNFKFTAGLASLISYAEIVNRYYFASCIFLILPLLIYLILIKFKKIRSPAMLIFTTIFCMYLIFMYSKYINNKGIYFENVQSILKSRKDSNMSIGVNDLEIQSIGVQIQAAQKKYGSEKFTYCSTYDKGHILKYVYRLPNVAFDRFPDYYAFNLNECMKSFANSVAIN